MKVHGLPETLWIVTKPSPLATAEDILVPCAFDRLMQRAREGFHEDEIAGVFVDEGEARQAAARLLGIYPVRPQDAVFAEVIVNIMVQPHEETTASDLARAAVEAVRNAVRQAEKAGFRHRLAGRISLGVGTVDLRNIVTATS